MKNLNHIKTLLRFKYHIQADIFKNLFWFITGALITVFLLLGITYFYFQTNYKDKVFPGIFVAGVDVGGLSKDQVKSIFDNKNLRIGESKFIFNSDYGTATASAKDISIGYDSELMSQQTYLLGRSTSLLSNISIIAQAYITGIKLSASYSFSQGKLQTLLTDIKKNIDKDPINAQFKFENGRVTTFVQSKNGQELDFDNLERQIDNKTFAVITAKNPISISINIPIKIIEPEIKTQDSNKFGIKELIGEGHSLFYHSIPSRIYNINLAATRMNGILVAPNEEFSFDKALGDVSSFTGYKQAYVIQNGKTVLGDGGGVCQVSTTFFRALLNAGLPITERHAHAYRVGYYEEDSPPGIDATIYTPTVDLKFKNDTGHYILIQSSIDLNNLSLAFYFYGVSDGRKVTMTKPVITSQTPPLPTIYQDDPDLPVGTLQQTDFAAWGANVYFTRTVVKNGKTIISEKFASNYQPWAAVYLRGTKQ